MRRPELITKSLLVLLLITGCFLASPVLHAKYRILIEADGKNQFDLIRAAKTISVLIQEDYPEAKGVSLPLAAITKKLFNYAGIKIITSSSSSQKIVLNINITGKALWADYRSIGKQYLGADLQGTISFQNGVFTVYENDFHNLRYPPKALFVVNDLKATASPTGAPFESVCRQSDPGCFIPLLAEMIGTIYDVKPLLAALKDPDDNFRASIVTAIGQLKEPRNINVIIPLLKDSSEEVKRAAATALGAINDPRAVEPLLKTLQDDSQPVRTAAIQSLGKMADRRAVTPLLILLPVEKSVEIRRDIITALGAIGDNRAIKPVLKALEDDNPQIRNAAVEAAGKLKVPNAVELLLEFMHNEKNFYNPNLPVLDPGENPDLRKTAAKSLVQSINNKDFSLLISALDDQDPLIRMTVAEALGKTNNPVSLDALNSLLADPDPKVREAAVTSLGVIGDPRSIDPLKTILKNPATSIPMRFTVIEALGSIKDIQAMTCLLEEFNNAGPREKTVIYRIIRQIDELSIAHPLVAVLTNSDVKMRSLAVETLERLQWKPANETDRYSLLLAKEDWPECVKAGEAIVPLLNQFINDEDRNFRENICITLLKIKSPKAIPALVIALKDKNSKIRQIAAKALTELEWTPQNEAQQITFYIANNQLLDCAKYGKSALEELIAALEDDNPLIRLNAVRALSIINDPESVEPMIDILHYADNDLQIREMAIISLGKSKDQRAYEPLIDVLNNEPDKELRQTAVIALGELGDKRAAGPLLEIFNETDFRSTAAIALGLLKEKRAVEPLLKYMEEESDINNQIAIIKALGMLQDKRAVKSLTSIYQDPSTDLQLRCTIVKALGQINDPKSFPIIFTSLSDPEWELKTAAAETIENIIKINDTGILVNLLSSPNSFARKIAAKTLARVKWVSRNKQEQAAYFIAAQQWSKCVSLGEPAVQPLLLILKDEDWRIQLQVVEALGRIKNPQALSPLSEIFNDPTNHLDVRLAVVEAFGRIPGDQALASLMLTLYDTDLLIRKKAAFTLGETKDSRTIDPLIMAYKDPQNDLELRLIILQALGKIINPKAVELLVKSLNNSNTTIRKTALTILLNIKNPNSTRFIIKSLRDTDPEPRAILAEELIKLGETKLADGQIDILISILNSTNVKPDIKLKIIRTLTRINDYDIITPLIDALNDPDITVKKAAAEALQKLNTPQILEPLAGIFNDADNATKKAILPVITGIKESRAVEILITALRDDSPEIRELSAGIISGLTENYAVIPLINILNDQNIENRILAIDTLGKIKDFGAVNPLISLLKQKKDDREIRLHSITALGIIGDRQAAKPLVAVLKEKDYALQIAACEALGLIKEVQAIEPLISLLKNKYAKEWFVDNQAAWALTEITGEDFGLDYQQWKDWWRKNKKEFKTKNFK